MTPFPIAVHPPRPRAGLAAVEFVMALTVVLFLLVALLWVGRVATSEAAVRIDARRDAWRRRGEARPPSFDYTDADAGRVRGEAELPIRVSPVFDGLITPRATVSVAGGSWDHRAERLERSPNRRLYPVLLRTAVAAELADLADVDGLLRSLADSLAVDPAADGDAASFTADADAARQRIDAVQKERERQRAEAENARRREFESLLRQIADSRSAAQRTAKDLDGRIDDLRRQATEHAAREPQDDAWRKEAERLRKDIEALRTERQEVDGRLRELDALETETRRQAAS